MAVAVARVYVSVEVAVVGFAEAGGGENVVGFADFYEVGVGGGVGGIFVRVVEFGESEELAFYIS